MEDRPRDTLPPRVFPLSIRSVELGQILVGLSITFLLLSSVLFGIYISSRIRPVLRLELDDWIASAAYILTTTDTSIGFSTATLTLGKQPRLLATTDLPRIGKNTLANAFLGAWAMAAIKISVACLFLRLKRSAGRPWRRFLSVMIAVQIITATFNMVMQATRFHPINARWSADKATREGARVWSDHAFGIAVSITSSSNVFTDIVFSILPVILLWDIQVPLREKVVVGSLMALGLVASAASIVKAVKIQSFGKGDRMLQGMEFGIWSLLEEQLGLIAACVPRLKVQIQQFLIRRGLIGSSNSNSRNSGPYKYALRRNVRQQSGGGDPYNAPFFTLSDHSIELTPNRSVGVDRSAVRASVDDNIVLRRM